jgi:cell division protein FtsL
VPANESNKYTIEYMSIIPLLAKSIQELSEKINNQQKIIDDLNDKLNKLSNIE